MILEDLLKYLKRNKMVQVSKMDTYKISFDDIEEICHKFNWTVVERDGMVRFVDSCGNELEDFSEYELEKSKYRRPITMVFGSQEDCEKFKVVFPAVRDQCINKFTTTMYIDDFEHGHVVNSRRGSFDGESVKDIAIPVRTHAQKTWDVFDHWREMPEYYFNFTKDIYVKVVTFFDREVFTDEVLTELTGTKVHFKTDSIWFPPKAHNEFNHFRVLGGDEQPKYPIYIVSKGRANQYRLHTSESLSRMKVHHYVCVEPQEREAYDASKINQHEYCHIITMDMSYKDKYNVIFQIGQLGSTGPGPARNFCADHARSNGFHWCWILDDNTEDFFRVWRGRRFICHTPEVFCHLERLVDRYENVALAGINYHMFMINQDPRPPFIINTRIYSYGLWNLDCPYITQEGRYNEDTIQSINVMKEGWCTLQSNLYVARKLMTQVLKGGNTAEFYAKEGTFAKSQLLAEYYPEYTSLVWKFRRWHHEVNYNLFKTKLKYRPEYAHLADVDYNKIDEHGAYIVHIDGKYHLKTQFDNKDFLEKLYPKGCPEDITHSLMFLPEDRNNLELRNFWPDETPGPCTIVRRLRSDKYESNEVVEEVVESPLFDDGPADVVQATDTSAHKEESVAESLTRINVGVEGKREFEEKYSIENL